MSSVSSVLAAPDPVRHRSRRRRGSLAFLVVLALAGSGVWLWWRGYTGHIVVRPHCSAEVGGATTELDPEQSGYAALIATIAVERGLPARAASIGIATAMQESKLRNLDYGDRDSLGLFQQRPSQGWGTVRQITDPVYATNAFYDVLMKIEGFQDLTITDAAQRVQRSAFPTAYAEHEPEARALASALTGYSEGSFACVLHPPGQLAREDPGAAGLTTRARRVATAARRETGQTRSEPASPDGTAVRFRIGGSDAERRGWSLAHWAVARADGLDVVAVATDGLRWRREAPGARWSRIAAGSGPRPPAGTVVVEVAAGG
ncbi:MAG: hypothetical protein GXX79_00750 [Actinomycetales bacterium]|nr:hypothetical protein [Actinomycetales bacterium]